ncbi:class II aldolase/adducin family protein, partial [Rhodoferax sp.]|uniref:class II aldolase/adducin family protein n=1 Tax=Rhodoferax sp. TaxID=50421 RepID=UPI0025FF5C2C
MDHSGVQRSGDKASKSFFLHAQIYKAATTYQADTRCVIHTHSTHCVAEAIHRYGQAQLPIRAVMLSRLGPNVWHDSPSAAMATLEETAKLVSKNLSSVCALTEPQLYELRQIFDVKW